MATTPLIEVPPQLQSQGAPLIQNGLGAHEEPRSEDGRYVSEEVYWAEYYELSDFHYEWNNGRLEEKPLSDYAQYRLYVWFLDLLKDFLHVNPIARMIGLETGFRMALPAKTVIRKPDLGVVLNNNIVPLGDKDRSYKGIFDICLESISDSTRKETERDTVVKKQEYAAAGVREYYLLDERRKQTEFYRLNHYGLYVPIQPIDGIIHSTVLPGFRFRIHDLYQMRLPPQLLDDEIYQDYVSPFLRAERIFAEQERRRAEQEAARAIQAENELRRVREQAARYEAHLRTLGINPDTLA